jgi:hypothetical protein
MIGKTLAAAAFALALVAGMGSALADPGDRIDGAPIIERLDAASLPRGQMHRFYFRAGDQNTGQGWYVPVMVMTGAKPGPRLLLTAAIHGDELNGIAVIHKLFAETDPRTLKGAIVAVPGLNTPGLIASNRNLQSSNDGGGAVNLNRVMPGNPDADEFGAFYAGRLWSNLLARGCSVGQIARSTCTRNHAARSIRCTRSPIRPYLPRAAWPIFFART